MKFYHATSGTNTLKILGCNEIKPGYDGIIYLCKAPEDCCKFVFIRGAVSCNVLELELDENDVVETF